MKGKLTVDSGPSVRLLSLPASGFRPTLPWEDFSYLTGVAFASNPPFARSQFTSWPLNGTPLSMESDCSSSSFILLGFFC